MALAAGALRKPAVGTGHARDVARMARSHKGSTSYKKNPHAEGHLHGATRADKAAGRERDTQDAGCQPPPSAL